MTKTHARRVIWIAAVIVTILIIALIRHYASAQSDYWDGRKLAEKTALSQTEMTVVHESQLFHGEAAYWVVSGENADGRELYVWIQKNEPELDSMTLDPKFVYADEGTTESEVRHRVTEEHENARIVRIVLGLREDEPVWEVFYEAKTDKGARHFYDYYRFTDGEWIETLKLAG